jgi:hypothetical protein
MRYTRSLGERPCLSEAVLSAFKRIPSFVVAISIAVLAGFPSGNQQAAAQSQGSSDRPFGSPEWEDAMRRGCPAKFECRSVGPGIVQMPDGRICTTGRCYFAVFPTFGSPQAFSLGDCESVTMPGFKPGDKYCYDTQPMAEECQGRTIDNLQLTCLSSGMLPVPR